MTVAVDPLLRVIPVHWMVRVEMASEPEAELTQPAALAVVGVVQPVGTVMSTSPLLMPPVAAV